MTAATDVELDQATRDELQPPCDAEEWDCNLGCYRDCTAAAEWIVKTKCDCGSAQVFTCGRHMDEGMLGEVECVHCGGDERVQSVTKL